MRSLRFCLVTLAFVELKVAIDENRAQHTLKDLGQTPAPANIQQLNDERWAIPEQTTLKLKQALGEDGFNKLDAWVTKHHGQVPPAAAQTRPDGSTQVQPTPVSEATHK